MKIYVLTLLLFYQASCFAQSKINNELNTILNKSLLICINDIKHSVGVDSLNISYFDNLHISISNYPNDFIFDENIKASNLKFINIYGKSSIKQKKSVNAISLVSYVLSGNKLIVHFVDINILRKKKNINISTGSGTIFTYEYSCDKKEWGLIIKKTYGI